jgi:hypothetical protein
MSTHVAPIVLIFERAAINVNSKHEKIQLLNFQGPVLSQSLNVLTNRNPAIAVTLSVEDSRPLRPREKALARRLSQDPEVTNRLIQQALYFLGYASRKDALDRKLVEGRG